jgi:hypothetical protein
MGWEMNLGKIHTRKMLILITVFLLIITRVPQPVTFLSVDKTAFAFTEMVTIKYHVFFIHIIPVVYDDGFDQALYYENGTIVWMHPLTGVFRTIWTDATFYDVRTGTFTWDGTWYSQGGQPLGKLNITGTYTFKMQWYGHYLVQNFTLS